MTPVEHPESCGLRHGLDSCACGSKANLEVTYPIVPPRVTVLEHAHAEIRSLTASGNLKDRRTLKLLRDRINSLAMIERLFEPQQSPEERERRMLTDFKEQGGGVGAGYLQPGQIDFSMLSGDPYSSESFGKSKDPLDDNMPLRHQGASAVETHSAHMAREIQTAIPRFLSALEAQADPNAAMAKNKRRDARLSALRGIVDARHDRDAEMEQEFRKVLAGLDADEQTATPAPAATKSIGEQLDEVRRLTEQNALKWTGPWKGPPPGHNATADEFLPLSLSDKQAFDAQSSGNIFTQLPVTLGGPVEILTLDQKS